MIDREQTEIFSEINSKFKDLFQRVIQLEAEPNTGSGGGGGAPANAEYLVNTANATLTNEIVVTAAAGRIMYADIVPTWVTLNHPGAANKVLQSTATIVQWSTNDLILNGDLTVPAVGGTAALGAGTNSVSSINDATIANHTHAITSSDNPGAAPSIISTDANGDITLVGLTLTQYAGLVAPFTDYALTFSNRASISFPTNDAAGLTIYAGLFEFMRFDSAGQYVTKFNHETDDIDFEIYSQGGLSFRIEASTLQDTVAAFRTFRVYNNDNNASVEILRLSGNRNGGPGSTIGTGVDNDEAYTTYYMANDASSAIEFARLTVIADDVSDTSEDGHIEWSLVEDGSLVDELGLNATSLYPITNDGLALGTSSLAYSDLYLASGAVINWDASDITLTHSANTLTFAGIILFDFGACDIDVKIGNFDGINLISGSVINWDTGDITLTHSANTLTFAGMSTFDLGTSDLTTTGNGTFANVYVPANGDVGMNAGPRWTFDNANGKIDANNYNIDFGGVNHWVGDNIGRGMYVNATANTNLNSSTNIYINCDSINTSVVRFIQFGHNVNDGTTGTSLMRVYEDGNVVIGDTTADRRFHVTESDAVTNAVTYTQRNTHISSAPGSLTAGFGIGIEFELSDTGGNLDIVCQNDIVYTDPTTTTEDADWLIKLISGGSLGEAFRIISDGALGLQADITTDTAPNDDTTIKRLSLQKLASPPTNAAYIAFSNNPGTDIFYLVLEEG